MRRLLPLVSAVLVLAFAGAALAGGFNIYEMGSRATALGGAFTATADDPSAIFYNPAALAWQQMGWEASLNISPINPNTSYARADGQTAVEYTGAPTGDTTGSWFFPTGAYVGYRWHEKWSAGFGFFTPFGLGVEWENPENFAGRPESTHAQIQGLYFSPVLTYQFTPKIAVSAGAHLVKSHLKLENIQTTDLSGTAPDNPNVISTVLEGGSDWSVGFAGALMYKPIPRLALGVNFKGGVNNKFVNSDATFTQIPTGSSEVDDLVSQQLDALGGAGTQNVSGELKYPSMLALGVRYDFSEKFGLEFDGVWFGWSDFDSVTLNFEKAGTQTLREEYEDVWQLRFGAEFTLNPSWRFMAGYVKDNSPQPIGSVSPLLPDADRNDYSIGATWTSKSGKDDVTLGYMLVDFDERSTVVDGVGQNFDGFDATYKTVVNIFTAGYTRRF